MTGERKVDTITQFRLGDLLPADDPVSEWVATLTLAFNDIALVHGEFDEAYEGPAYRYFYLLRVALSHFNEAAKYLDETEDIAEVRAYVESLPEGLRELYDDSLRRYRERRGFLAQVRNLSAFHYPEMKPSPGPRGRLMKRLLEELAEATTSMYKGASGTIGDSRALFGDDIASKLFTRGASDDDELIAHHVEVKEAITSFMRFANGAINEWIGRAIDGGVSFTTRPGRPPSFGAVVETAANTQRRPGPTGDADDTSS
jgi:hypothetical protein